MKQFLTILSISFFLATSHGADASAPAVTLEKFKLVAELTNARGAFTLTALARVENPKGGSLELLSGTLALTEVGAHKDWQLRAEQNRFIITFNRRGEFPLELKFDAAVTQRDGWKSVDFHVAPASVLPVVLRGLPADTQFEFAGAARPERTGAEFASFLPSDGSVKLSWKEVRPEVEGKLFYSAEMLSQLTLSPGLMRQAALLDFKVMQGELNRVALRLQGAGEVTRVQGDSVLAWNLEPISGSADRRLVVQFNQPQKDQFSLQVQMQTPLGAFPQDVEAMQVRPEAATRFAGYFRVVNEGAVRLEVAQAKGLSQISPEQFPESDATRTALRLTGNQRFVYRFSGAECGLRIQADQILPELAVSELAAYRLGENELAIDAELELDIREAPLRELLLRVPKGYVIARLAAAGMSDYFSREPEGQPDAELRLVYGQPVSGRQVVQLRLERNQPLAGTNWMLPRLEIPKAKSLRGHIAVTADAGFRLSPERTQGLTEIATAFFPRKVAGIQTAFRLSDAGWSAAVRVERLPQAVQADALHLFSISEGIAYGSSVLNYVVSGAPVASFRVELAEEYSNVEFTGKDLRNWQKTEGGYLVQLHTPVSGPYTLLATYERPFKAQGETLSFAGARPLDAQSEQGHALVTSACQFQVKPAEVSPGLLALETGEVPPEYRLFFDAPILAAYRYVSRPFNLKLALSPLTQGESLNQVVERASLTTRISKEGQVLTEAHYFLKNRGNPNLRLSLPEDTQLWSATVNGKPVVPVKDASANLIPLPPGADPNAVLAIDLKLAGKSADPNRVKVTAPVVNAPLLLGEWKLEPDAGQRLVYRQGTLAPAGAADVSGFAQMAQPSMQDVLTPLLAGLVFAGLALAVWHWAGQEGVFKFSLRHLGGTVLGLLCFACSLVAFINCAHVAEHQKLYPPAGVSLLAPVQPAGSVLSVEVGNVADGASALAGLKFAWPALLAVAAWLYAWKSGWQAARKAGWILGWSCLAWAALRFPNGFTLFLGVLMAFLWLQVAIPSLRHLWRLPRKPEVPPVQPAGTATSAAAMLLLGTGLWLAAANTSPAAPLQSTNPLPMVEPRAELVVQDIRIEDKFALATAKIRWQAEKGQVLPLLAEPAVLTRIDFPAKALRLVRSSAGSGYPQQLVAEKAGTFDIELQYETKVTRKEAESGLLLPVPYGLVNRLKLTVVNLDVEVLSPQAVSTQRELAGSNSVANLVLAPARDAWVGWKPRSRDLRQEKPLFYAEVTQLYVPAAGVLEGLHRISVRPAQGEVAELVLDVPAGATITDVLEPAHLKAPPGAGNPPTTRSLVSLWRFDPDARKLRVTLASPQSRPFTLLVRSQLTTGALPLLQSVGLLSVENAGGQLGLLGIATGNEVQLDAVTAEGCSPINLEDFPDDLAAGLQAQVPGLTVRRAFRYADMKATASLKASAVEPDVRVETQETLSLGEDRTVLAADATIDITRAGIFRLSFTLPSGFDVESISGSALSHWTELKNDEGRVITLHLNGKTEGRQQFSVSLAGPGVRATNSWSVPQLVLREAGKQQGTLVLVPEQGLRLQASTCEGLTQLDPQKSGIKQKGVLAFRVLQTPRKLVLALEQVEPWVQVNSLEHAQVSEALIKIAANLQYQIENTGLKAFRLWLPTTAENVRFQGEQLADFLPLAGASTNGLQLWEVRLHRRVIGAYPLQASYQTVLSAKATNVVLRGVQAADVNLQRGFLALQSGGRVQLRLEAIPATLQPTEWQSIPRQLKQGLQAATANFAFRQVEPDFVLPLKLERHEPAKLLEARVKNITLTSVISEAGIMLTQTRLELLPGDKRLLQVTLPKGAQFWFAFVNQNGVWPWREQERLLLPLEPQGRGNQPMVVELFYSSQPGGTDPWAPAGRSVASSRSLGLELLAPQFDLPLEDITWRVSLDEKWQVGKCSGSFQLQPQDSAAQPVALDLQNYLQSETTRQREQTKHAEELLASGNAALAQGDPQLARRSFQAAYALSAHDAAFNEDARVQLHNLKLQQALVGLNVRQAAPAGDAGTLPGKLRDRPDGQSIHYTQQEAKDLLDRNTADDNAALLRLAERLVQQQDAAVSSATALRVSLPEQGKVLVFKRAVAVDPRADLRIELKASALSAAGWGVRVVTLAATLLLLAGFRWAATRRPTTR